MSLLVLSSNHLSALFVVDINARVASMLWTYIEEIIFNMLILVEAVKMNDHIA